MFKKSFLLSLTLCVLATCSQEPLINAPNDLRCEFLTDPLSVDTPHPRLAWKLTGDTLRQTAYQILAATDEALLQEGKADLWDSNKTLSDNQTTVKYAGKDLSGNKLVYWKVRTWNSNDRASAWSQAARFGAGLTEAELNAAAYIAFPEANLPQEKERSITSPLLRKPFDWENGTTLLYVNSLGYHEVYINGKKAGDYVLAPAMSQFNKRSLYMTYDITPYLNKGGNELVVWLGEGWYSMGLPGVVYDGPAAKVILETNKNGQWTNVLRSDESWQCAESGYETVGEWNHGDYGGERIDASVLSDLTTSSLDKLSWHPVAKVDVPAHAVTPQMVEGNLIADEIKPVKVTQLSDSAWLVDMGKAFTGWTKIRFRNLSKGQEIALKYSDHFDDDGTLYHQRQRDYYRASGKDGETFCNRFNYHCCQYIQLSNLPAAPSLDDITGYTVHTGYGKTSSFECSDPDLNAIHKMIQRTLRNLSLGGYLVDCTHLERLGYGGDGNASTETAQTMFNLDPLYANWLRAWSDCVRDDGSMPHTAPNPFSAGGGPYWCGFIITASWRTYINYGDIRPLEQYYSVMQLWLDSYVEKYKVDGLLQRWPDTDYRGWYLGDWASPTGVDHTHPKSIEVVNNSFVCVCYETMVKIAKLLGKDTDAQRYSEAAETMKRLLNERCFDKEKNIYGTGIQVDLAFPMLADIPPADVLPKVKQSLFAETEKNRGGHIACGLVGIPVVTEWAIRNHEPDFIYSMLKKRDYPGYLYMLDNGGSATWEHWNGDRSRLHNCYNGVGAWFYEAVAGIRPDETAPGYKRFFIDPQIPQGVTWAKATKETPYGTLAVDWKLSDGELHIRVTVPSGSEAVVVLPEGTTEYTFDRAIAPAEGNLITLKSGTTSGAYSYKN